MSNVGVDGDPDAFVVVAGDDGVTKAMLSVKHPGTLMTQQEHDELVNDPCRCLDAMKCECGRTPEVIPLDLGLLLALSPAHDRGR